MLIDTRADPDNPVEGDVWETEVDTPSGQTGTWYNMSMYFKISQNSDGTPVYTKWSCFIDNSISAWRPAGVTYYHQYKEDGTVDTLYKPYNTITNNGCPIGATRRTYSGVMLYN